MKFQLCEENVDLVRHKPSRKDEDDDVDSSRKRSPHINGRLSSPKENGSDSQLMSSTASESQQSSSRQDYIDVFKYNGFSESDNDAELRRKRRVKKKRRRKFQSEEEEEEEQTKEQTKEQNNKEESQPTAFEFPKTTISNSSSRTVSSEADTLVPTVEVRSYCNTPSSQGDSVGSVTSRTPTAQDDTPSSSIMKFTRRQWLILVVFGIADFFSAVCISLQAPFYPEEAELKGATATEYGLVFGVFELTSFISSPIYGKYINKLGPTFMFNTGLLITGVCSILFGTLDQIEGHYAFIGLSFAVRIVEALGGAAALTASFAIIAAEFPNSVATTFASLETFFGLGLIAGPTIGGALYQVGGYPLPFFALGGFLLISAIIIAFIIPTKDSDSGTDKGSSKGFLSIFRIPSVALAAFSITAASISIGFNQSILEPHLRQFGFTPVVMGLMFIISGGTYAFTAPLVGRICDTFMPLKVAALVGAILIAIGYSLIGPAPFLPFDTTLWVCIVGLVLHGLGVAHLLVSSFIDGLRSTTEYGYPNDISTYGLISGMWASMFSLGAFIGPSIAGALYDAVGFRMGTLFVIGTQLLLIFFIVLFICMTGRLGPSSRPRYRLLENVSESLCETNGVDGKLKKLKSLGVNNGTVVVGEGVLLLPENDRIWHQQYGTVRPSLETVA